ncbi:MAG: chemotaxis protein CheD [Symbiobacteriaceae bacterium]|nr:chemotaxis protein CheD [Symbiobacteriaceae bacterium]
MKESDVGSTRHPGEEYGELETYFLQPGYIYASHQPIFLNTVLGSCVAIALWDSLNGFGGMCHYIYPHMEKNARNARYGDVAIPYLVRLMQDLGSVKSNLKAHVIGGGVNPELGSQIGEGNAKVAERILKQQGIEIVTLDVGGAIGKKISFNTQTGELLVYITSRIREADWYR